MGACEQAQSSCQRACIALALMLIYFTVDNHVGLNPWNNLAQAGSQWPSTLAGWVPGLFTLWALWHNASWAVGRGLSGLSSGSSSSCGSGGSPTCSGLAVA